MATLTDIKNARNAYLTAKALRDSFPTATQEWCDAADTFMAARQVLLAVARDHFVETAPNEAIRRCATALYAEALDNNLTWRNRRAREGLVDMLLNLNCG